MGQLRDIYGRYRYLSLLTTLLALLVLTPLLDSTADITFYLNLFLTLTLLSSISYLSSKIPHILLGFLFATPYLIEIWIDQQIPIPHFKFIALGCVILYYLYALGLLIAHILRQKEGGRELIFAALSGFLIIGIAWSFIYTLIYLFDPSSFSEDIFTQGDIRYTFVYFSFVTLSTLGYGDISPLTPIAQSWTILEAVIGQMYMVVLVAGLVGKFSTSTK